MSGARRIEAIVAASLAIGAAWALPSAVTASEREAIREGNKLYEAGELDRALEKYQAAEVESPESPHVFFNMGDVYYRKGDYAKAREFYERSALKSRDLKLEAKAQYNLGNCAFQEAERQKDSDLKKALDAYPKAVGHYRQALKLDEGLEDAGHNIEVTRLIMKDLLDRLKKQQEEQQKQQEQGRQTAEDIKKLMVREKDLLDKTSDAEKKGEKDKAKDLAAQQEDIRQKTKELSERLAQQQQQQNPNPPPQGQQPSPASKVKEHVDRSAEEQAQAEKKLQAADLKDAKGNEQKAVDELAKALEEMSSGQPQPQPEPSDQGKDEEKKKQEGKDRQQDPGKKKDEGKQKKEEQKKAALSQDRQARDILDEEKENRERRQVDRSGYEPVGKDW